MSQNSFAKNFFKLMENTIIVLIILMNKFIILYCLIIIILINSFKLYR
jgi:hypothetical protein